MGKTPCNAEGLKKGAWTAEEDKKLIAWINEHGEGGWRTLPEKAGLQRCGKSCRLRWTNYLRPDIKRGEFSPEEQQAIIQLHAANGNKWSLIAKHLPSRTDNEIKNYWNTHIKKHLAKKGINSATHKPINIPHGSPPTPSSSNVTPMDPNLTSLHQSPKSTSLSAKLLNKVANKLAHTFSHDVLFELIEGPTGQKGEPKMPASNSTSRLLNKMATNLTCIRQTLSTSIENDAHYSGDHVSDNMGNGFHVESSLSSPTSSFSESALLEMPMGDTSLSPSCYNFDHLDTILQNWWQGKGISQENDIIEQGCDMSYDNIETLMPTINLLQGNDQYPEFESSEIEENNHIKEDLVDEQLPTMNKDDNDLVNYVDLERSFNQDNNTSYWNNDVDNDNGNDNCELSYYDSQMPFEISYDNITSTGLPYFDYENQ